MLKKASGITLGLLPRSVLGGDLYRQRILFCADKINPRHILPIFGDGNTLYAILTASVVLWCFHITVLRGVKEAAIINTVVTGQDYTDRCLYCRSYVRVQR